MRKPLAAKTQSTSFSRRSNRVRLCESSKADLIQKRRLQKKLNSARELIRNWSDFSRSYEVGSHETTPSRYVKVSVSIEKVARALSTAARQKSNVRIFEARNAHAK